MNSSKHFLFIFPILSIFYIVVLTSPFKRICYLRPEINFPIDWVIKFNLCSHIIIAFISINSQSQLSYDQFQSDFIKLCKRTIDDHQAKVKLMFSVGGGGAGGWTMASSTIQRRKSFANSVLSFINEYNLDGIDIDWEFPAWPKKIRQYFEKYDFIYLLKEIRDIFNDFETSTRKHLLLSTAVAGQLVITHFSYLPNQIAKYVDFINLMTYDYFIYKWYWPLVGHNSPLYARSRDVGLVRTFNVEWAANYWNNIGVEKKKIMVGIPTYGKRYKLFSKYFNFPGAIAINGDENDCSYSQVCDFLKLNGTIEQFDFEAQVPYAHNQYDWISFENEISAMIKVQWIQKNHFGGVMLFSLNADDFKSRCTSYSPMFAIHSAVRDILIT